MDDLSDEMMRSEGETTSVFDNDSCTASTGHSELCSVEKWGRTKPVVLPFSTNYIVISALAKIF